MATCRVARRWSANLCEFLLRLALSTTVAGSPRHGRRAVNLEQIETSFEGPLETMPWVCASGQPRPPLETGAKLSRHPKAAPFRAQNMCANHRVVENTVIVIEIYKMFPGLSVTRAITTSKNPSIADIAAFLLHKVQVPNIIYLSHLIQKLQSLKRNTSSWRANKECTRIRNKIRLFLSATLNTANVACRVLLQQILPTYIA